MVTNTKVPKPTMRTQGVKLLSLGSSSGSDKTEPFLERSSGRTKVYDNMKVNLQKFTPLPLTIFQQGSYLLRNTQVGIV